MSLRITYCAAAIALMAACINETQRGGASVESVELALRESALTAQLDALIADAADRSSRFDIGQGFESAAEQLKTQLHQGLPCAAVTREGSMLSIVYGALSAECSSHGRTLAGQHSVRVMRNADNEVGVHHEFIEFRDTRVSLSGSADVSWSRTSPSRRVVHTLAFRVLSGDDMGMTGQSTGDSTQQTLDQAIRINGLRQWQSSRGAFALDMQAIEQRFADSVPQFGAYDITLPTADTLTLAFGRIDTDTIGVTVQGAQEDMSFMVRPDGSIAR